MARINSSNHWKTSAALIVVFFILVPQARADQEVWWFDHPARKAESYNFPPAGALADKVIAPPAFLLDFLSRIHLPMDPNHAEYKAYIPTENEMDEISGAWNGLPEPYRKIISEKALAVSFVENMAMSGYTFRAYSADGGEYFVTALNADVLHKDISAWLTDKTASCFSPDDSGVAIRVDAGAPATAFYFTFYHEAAHVIDGVLGITPGWKMDPAAQKYRMRGKKESDEEEKFLFVRGAWAAFDAPLPDYDFPGRESITFYGLDGGPKLSAEDAPAMYRALERTPFVSLYGSQNWLEDFAELFALRLHLKRPGATFRVTISKNGEVLYKSPDDPMKTNLNTNRLKLLDKMEAGN